MEKETFQSDTVSFTIDRKPHCIVEYQVKIKPKIVGEARKKALRHIAKQVSIPGFRKGKAPDNLISKKYPEQLEEEWKKQIADLAFVACQKTNFTPLLDKNTTIVFNITSFSLEEGAEGSFSFESEPIIPEVDVSVIKLEEVEEEVIDEKKINESIEQIQKFFATREAISDRSLNWGDSAYIDIEDLEKDPPEKIFDRAYIEITKEKLAKWMSELLIGMNTGETREGVSQPDDDATQEDKEKMPPKKVRVTLREIEILKLPPIDDALAQKVGVTNVEEVKTNLKKVLEKQAKEAVKHKYRDQLNDYLFKTYPFDLPQSIVQNETKVRLSQLMETPSFKSKLPTMTEEDKKNLIADIEAHGKRALLLFYLSRKVVQDQNITISPKDIENTEKTPLEFMFSSPSNHYDATQDSQEQKALAFSRIVLEKAEDYLISHAETVPPKPKEEKEETKQPPAEDKSKPEDTKSS